jgi:hypothetical protein
MNTRQIEQMNRTLARIADALERIAGTEDHALQRMEVIRQGPWDGAKPVPQRVTPQRLMASTGIEDLSLPDDDPEQECADVSEARRQT